VVSVINSSISVCFVEQMNKHKQFFIICFLSDLQFRILNFHTHIENSMANIKNSVTYLLILKQIVVNKHFHLLLFSS
jgi:hypothetical protein